MHIEITHQRLFIKFPRQIPEEDIEQKFETGSMRGWSGRNGEARIATGMGSTKDQSLLCFGCPGHFGRVVSVLDSNWEGKYQNRRRIEEGRLQEKNTLKLENTYPREVSRVSSTILCT